MAGTDGRGPSAADAVLTCGPVLLFDGWMLAAGSPVLLVPMALVLVGAAIGAGTARAGSPAPVRLCRAGVGALVAHFLLAVLLFVLLLLFPPRIPW
ncbi:hypothetical protein [Kitasatospora cineracea]|uniref:Uncharacterized protein n=1 Tax=Kitasatospora cineracea TaxID=88074 RepID=A0A8G1UNH2_9ACTN|nr:hypothetical protein [Kitasatospora cineracea]ROR44852.1 hypothetical protein EDD39_3062 [Kitasatospora cineracea]